MEEQSDQIPPDNPIIAPGFRNYLFRYTWILFAIHFGLTAILHLFRIDMVIHIFPLQFSVSGSGDIFDLINRAPMIFLMDFGLVTLILYFITRSKIDIRLPWPTFRSPDRGKTKNQPPAPKPILLMLGIAGTGVLGYFFLTYRTLFFRSLNPGAAEPLLTSPASTFYSLVVLGWCGLELFFYTLRFFSNTFRMILVKNLVFLVVLWLLMNLDIPGEFIDIEFLSFPDLKTGIILLITVVIFIETLENTYRMIRQRRGKE